MRKSADAVTPMQPNSEITLLYPREVDWSAFEAPRPDVPFSDDAVEYLDALSSLIMKNPSSRQYPDVITFAFFCRRASLVKMKSDIATDKLRLGRGLVFHVAPSNVPVNFAYSLVSGLLAGNMNVVRVSSKSFAQVDIIIKAMLKLLDERRHSDVASRFAIVRYERSSGWNDYFSSIANVRVVWGGDKTVEALRQSPLPPRSYEVCFADRYSIASFGAKKVLNASDAEIEHLAAGFYNDTYLFDQNACSAPHLIVWLKDTPQFGDAENKFWKAVHSIAKKKYDFQPVMAVDKLTTFFRQSADMKCRKEPMPDNVLFRLHLDELPINIDEYRCPGGYFYEYEVDNLNEIAHIISLKYQTMAYYGISHSELEDFVFGNRLTGLDRVVPVGETSSFSFDWDGYDLIETLSRQPVIV